MSVLINVLKTLLGLVLMLVLLPVMLPLMAFFWVVSILVKVCYALLWRSSVKKVKGLDSMWGVEEKVNKPFVIACLRLHGAKTLHSVQQAILNKVIEVQDSDGNYKYRKFRQLFLRRCGYYCWRDDPHFDINNHVREVKLSSHFPAATSEDVQGPEEAVAGEDRQQVKSEAIDEMLQQFMSEELAKAVPDDIPPWEVLLVARDDGRYNVLMRIHHAIGDGVTFVRLCVECLVDTPVPPPPITAVPPNPFVKVAFMLWSLIMLPFGLVKAMANFDRNCLHGPPLSGRKIITWSKEMPMDVLHQVRNAASSTVNDVFMTCVSAALTKHFIRRKDKVKKVTVGMPVSFHDPRMPLKLTNLFSIATYMLPVGKELTPPDRLAAIKNVVGAAKKNPTLRSVYWVGKVLSEILPAPMPFFLFSGRGHTLAASNVPGPKQEIIIWGDRVEDMMFWVPNRGPVGVGVSFFSYKGMVKIGLNVDLALFHSKAEVKQLVEDMEEELSLLYHHFLP